MSSLDKYWDMCNCAEFKYNYYRSITCYDYTFKGVVVVAVIQLFGTIVHYCKRPSESIVAIASDTVVVQASVSAHEQDIDPVLVLNPENNLESCQKSDPDIKNKSDPETAEKSDPENPENAQEKTPVDKNNNTP